MIFSVNLFTKFIILCVNKKCVVLSFSFNVCINDVDYFINSWSTATCVTFLSIVEKSRKLFLYDFNDVR